MMSISLPAWYAAPWASSQALSELSAQAMAAGFPSGLAQRPTRQDLNRALEFATNGVLYYMSHGIPEWIPQAQYRSGSVVAHGGSFYRSNAVTQGAEPGSGGAWEALLWRRSQLDQLFLSIAYGDERFLTAAGADDRFYPRQLMTDTFITPSAMASIYAPSTALAAFLTRSLGTIQFLTQAVADGRYVRIEDAVPLIDENTQWDSKLAFRIGGAAVGNFAGDAESMAYWTPNGGFGVFTMPPVDISALTNPAPAELYETCRWRPESANWPVFRMQLLRSSLYRLRLHIRFDYYGVRSLRQSGVDVVATPWFNAHQPLIAEGNVVTDANGWLELQLVGSPNFVSINGLEILHPVFPWTIPLLSREAASQTFFTEMIGSQRWLNEAQAPSIFVSQVQASETLQDKETAAISLYSSTKTYSAGMLAVGGEPTRIYRSQVNNNTGNALTDPEWWRPWSLPTHLPTESWEGRFLRCLRWDKAGAYQLDADFFGVERFPDGIPMKFVLKGAGGLFPSTDAHGASEGALIEVIAKMKPENFPLTAHVGSGSIVDADVYSQGSSLYESATWVPVLQVSCGASAPTELPQGWLRDDQVELAYGAPGTVSQPIDTSGVMGAAPAIIYQTYRYANAAWFWYTNTPIPGFDPAKRYKWRFHFSNIFNKQPGELITNLGGGLDFLAPNRTIDVGAFGAAGRLFIWDTAEFLGSSWPAGTMNVQVGPYQSSLHAIEVLELQDFRSKPRLIGVGAGRMSQAAQPQPIGGNAYYLDPAMQVLSQVRRNGAEGRTFVSGIRWGDGGGAHGGSGVMVTVPQQTPAHHGLYGGGAGAGPDASVGGDGFIEVYW
jgi:hypothetical protein